MDRRQENNNAWMSVPQFGGWDEKNAGATNYSVVFSKARANRKQHKVDATHASFGNERELMAPPKCVSPPRQGDPVTRKKKIFSFFNCFRP